jgi:uncharacterized membrane protein YhaH (DUF805 family)
LAQIRLQYQVSCVGFGADNGREGVFAMEWMLLPYKRYAEFSGRSRRMEYWMFTLFTTIVALLLVGLMMAGGFDLASLDNPAAPPPEPGPLFWLGVVGIILFGFGTIIPGIAVTVRRFHDRDMSGWWVLGFAVLSAIPLVGWIASIAQLVILALPGTSGANRFGEDPLDPTQADVFS